MKINRIRKAVAFLLAVLFLVTVTAGAVSAKPGPTPWSPKISFSASAVSAIVWLQSTEPSENELTTPIKEKTARVVSAKPQPIPWSPKISFSASAVSAVV